ncbi:MAG: glycosyltransferase family 2 protein [Succinivibrio sp.]|nr:glycosyltransferase family 2 protein [Succinivibrio sp.]
MITSAKNSLTSFNSTENDKSTVKVSLIIPVYNVQQYIRECLDSAISQTLKDIEIICVNDGSSDDSLAILEEYAKKDSRIVIINNTNHGYGYTINTGINQAKGEYIGILESDDLILPDMYASLYQIASKNKLDLIKSDHFDYFSKANIDALPKKSTITTVSTVETNKLGKSQPSLKTARSATSDIDHAHNNALSLSAKANKALADISAIKGRLKKVEIDPSHKFYDKVLDLTENFAPYLCSMYTWSGIYKRAYLNRYNIRHNESKGASFQDQSFWLQTFFHANRAMFLNQAFYCYRRDNSGSSTLNKNKVFCCCDEYAFIESLLLKQPESFKQRFFPMFVYLKFLCYYATFKRISVLHKREFIERIRQEFLELKNRRLLDTRYFSRRDKKKLSQLIHKPDTFYLRYLNRSSSIQKLFSIKKTKKGKFLILLGQLIKIHK